MAFSRIVKIGDGSTTIFSVNFTLGYMSKDDVTCRVGNEVDGLGAPIYRPITFLTNELLSVGGLPPGAGLPITFERTTSKVTPVVDFTNGDVMDEENLDLGLKQAMLLVHEVLDGRFQGWPTENLANFGKLYLGVVGSDPTTDAAGNPVQEGALYYNTIVKELRFFNGGVWAPASQQGLSLIDKSFTAGVAQTVYVLDKRIIDAANVLVWVAGVRLRPELDYTIANATLTLAVAPATNARVDTLLMMVAVLVNEPSAGSVTAAAISNNFAERAAVVDKIGALSTNVKVLTNQQRANVLINTGLSPAVHPMGVLSAVEGVAYPVSAVAGGAKLHYIPVTGAFVPLWDGQSFVSTYIGDGLTLDLWDQGASFNIDIGLVNIAGVPRLVSCADWLGGGGSHTKRGTGAGSAELQSVNGLPLNKFSQQVKYGPGLTTVIPAFGITMVGTIRPLITGFVTDTPRSRLLSNMFNAAPRHMIGPEIYALTHTWEANAWRLVRAEAGQYVEYLQTIGGRHISARCSMRVGSSTITARFVDVGIGVDDNGWDGSTTRIQGTATSTLPAHPTAEYEAQSGAGHHRLYFLERGGGADVQTWTGNYGYSRLTGKVIN